MCVIVLAVLFLTVGCSSKYFMIVSAGDARSVTGVQDPRLTAVDNPQEMAGREK
jgi:hypothetical protein